MPYLQLSKMLFRNQIHQALLHPPCWHGQNIDPAVTMAVILCYVLIAFYWQHLWFVEDKKSKAVGHNVLCFPTLQVFLGLINFFFRRLDGNRVTWIAANAFSGLKAMQSLWVHFLSQINISNLCWKLFQTCPRYLKLEKRRQWKRLARSTHIYQGWKNHYMYMYSPISTDQASSSVVSMQRFNYDENTYVVI